MNLFYNKEGIGDTLLISFKDCPREHIAFEQKGNIVRIYDCKVNETVGYNVFHASNIMNIEEKGIVTITEVKISTLNDELERNGFSEKLTFDLSPKFVVGYVEEKEKHPNADKLSVCKVNVGNEKLQIVCGAPNIAAGQKVVVAKVGAVMPSGLVIKDADLRGVASSGMICSAKELDLPNAPKEKGILILTDEYTVGAEFIK